MKVAVVARSVFPLHGYGGLERHVYDLVRALGDRDVDVTLITRDPTDAGHDPSAIHPGVRVEFVPYRTFPLAGRRGTTVLDRSTAYPMFGLRAGRRALDLVSAGRVQLVHGLGASVLGYARARRRASAPLVFNPQGLEEFGATDPSRARLKRAAYLPLRRAVLACAAAADVVIATDRALQPVVLEHLNIPSSRVRVIPNAVDLPAIDALAGPDAVADLRLRAAVSAD
jgi:glycosyltransferase involved in cell wall biosynthesis